jgi:hypothetical protein
MRATRGQSTLPMLAAQRKQARRRTETRRMLRTSCERALCLAARSWIRPGRVTPTTSALPSRANKLRRPVALVTARARRSLVALSSNVAPWVVHCRSHILRQCVVPHASQSGGDLAVSWDGARSFRVKPRSCGWCLRGGARRRARVGAPGRGASRRDTQLERFAVRRRLSESVFAETQCENAAFRFVCSGLTPSAWLPRMLEREVLR